MGAVHAFVAEVAREFVDSGEAANNQALQIELVGDTQIHRDVQCVVMSDEWTCGGAARNGLKNRSLNLKASVFVEEVSHRVDDAAAGDENVLHLVIDHEVNITHAVAQLRVVEFVVFHTVLFLDDRQRAQRFAQNRQFLDMDRDFAHLRAEGKAFHSDEVTDVQEALEDGVIHGLVLVGANLVALDIQLDTAFRILQFAERGGTHDAAAHDTACHGDFLELFEVVVVKLVQDFGSGHTYRKGSLRIRIDT